MQIKSFMLIVTTIAFGSIYCTNAHASDDHKRSNEDGTSDQPYKKAKTEEYSLCNQDPTKVDETTKNTLQKLLGDVTELKAPPNNNGKFLRQLCGTNPQDRSPIASSDLLTRRD